MGMVDFYYYQSVPVLIPKFINPYPNSNTICPYPEPTNLLNLILLTVKPFSDHTKETKVYPYHKLVQVL